MPESTICKTKRDGTLTIRDLASTNTYEVAFEAGDLNAAIPGPTINVFLDRGVLGTTPCVRKGDDQVQTGTFTATLRDVTDASVATLLDILTESGFYASTWVSTLGANAEVKLVSLEFKIAGLTHGDAADHTIVFNHARLTGSIAEGDFTTISVAWTAYELYPTVT